MESISNVNENVCVVFANEWVKLKSRIVCRTVINHMARCIRLEDVRCVRAMKFHAGNLSFNFQTCSFNTVKCKYLPDSEVISKCMLFCLGQPNGFGSFVRSLCLCVVHNSLYTWVILNRIQSILCALFFSCQRMGQEASICHLLPQRMSVFLNFRHLQIETQNQRRIVSKRLPILRCVRLSVFSALFVHAGDAGALNPSHSIHFLCKLPANKEVPGKFRLSKQPTHTQKKRELSNRVWKQKSEAESFVRL